MHEQDPAILAALVAVQSDPRSKPTSRTATGLTIDDVFAACAPGIEAREVRAIVDARRAR